MVDAWPANLPQKLDQDGFTEAVGDGLLESQPDVGPPITRRRSTAVIRPMSGTMWCTVEQIAIFRTFFETTVLGGALPFNFPDQIQEGTLLVKFLKSSLPSWSPISAELYQLRLSLSVLP